MDVSLGDIVLFHSLFEDHRDEIVLLIGCFILFKHAKILKEFFLINKSLYGSFGL